MRLLARFSLIAAAVVLAVGPLSAATVSDTSGTHLAAPAAPAAHPLAKAIEFVATGVGIFGLTVKKDIGSIAQKFVTRAQAAAPDYKAGVQAAGPTWEQNTAASEPAYDAGVQQAITNKKFGKGVAGKGTKYQTNATNLGSQRYGAGVANAQTAYQTGMQPVIAALQGLNLPPRGYRGSPQNQARSQVVATALAALRANK